MNTYDQENGNEMNRDVLARRLTRSKVFGTKKSLSSQKTQGNAFGKFDYEQKYEEDPPGEEVGDYARVWLTYLDETEQYDRDQVEGWKDTIDVLLVFAGLFSGVITAFVMGSTQNLQTNYTQVSANLLFELVQFQRVVMNGVPAGSISPTPINPNTPFVPSITDSVVNALWFTSLALALVTALLAVLTKQWLYQFSSLTYGTPRERSRLRQFRSQGLETWKVAGIVEFLPVLMHGALALFLVGLVVFLVPLKTEIAWIVGVITGIAYIFYIISTLLPLFDPQCPYTTILTKFFRQSWNIARYYWYFYCWDFLTNRVLFYTWKDSENASTVTIKDLVGLVTTPTSSILSSCLRHLYRFFRTSFTSIKTTLWIWERILSFSSPVISAVPLIPIRTLLAHRPRLLPKRSTKLRNDRKQEIDMVRQNGTSIDTDAIYWLYSASTNPSVQRVVNQSICALPYGIHEDSLIKKSLYEDLSVFDLEEDYSTLQMGTLRRLILAWLHYDDTITAVSGMQGGFLISKH